jgi:TonB family protein
MILSRLSLRIKSSAGTLLDLVGVLVFVFGLNVCAQQTAPEQPAPTTATGGQMAGQTTAEKPEAEQPMTAPAAKAADGITEDELRQMLAGKPIYLRGGYLDNSLSYNEHGGLIGHSPEGSYTLCGVQIDKVRLTRRKVELEGARYGLHFLGALASEDPTKAVDRVNITPKKKKLRITIDRELVVKAKKVKPIRGKGAAGLKTSAEAGPVEMAGADQAKTEIAAAAEQPAEQAAGAGKVTTATSPAQATKVLKEALNNVFAFGLDERMLAAMPAFWRLYYEAAAAKSDYRPADPAVLRQNTVDQKAKLLSTFEPASNQYAQDKGVVGMALYHVVIGADGRPGEIAVARPIGFGLDENAVEAIRNAKFEAAMKDGKPVPVLLDLVVEFRIYSKRTGETGTREPPDKDSGPVLPGPYSAEHP